MQSLSQLLSSSVKVQKHSGTISAPLIAAPGWYSSAIWERGRPARIPENLVPIIGKYAETGFQSLEKMAKPGSNHWKNGETGFQSLELFADWSSRSETFPF